MSREAIVTPDDLGRRIVHRRSELALSRDQVAVRAGMATGYVAYLEEHPARLSVPALIRLADALETTSGALLGEDAEDPHGARPAAPGPVLVELDQPECLRLLGFCGMGRMAILTPAGPEVLPVYYTLLDGMVIVRTDPAGTIAEHCDSEVGFEADHIDDTMSQGWSVLITGTAHPVTNARQLDRIRTYADPGPWAGPGRDLFLRIRPNRISGRRIEIA
jgi:hypothetical protein